ncbi:MAG: hypothetical protein HY791_02990 [Deltaproteobacteria bacterium]|nr:hypothetical protein [Deltaproteobacteria bacterium]
MLALVLVLALALLRSTLAQGAELTLEQFGATGGNAARDTAAFRAAIAEAKRTPEADRLSLVPGRTYTLRPDQAYRVAVMLDGVRGLDIETMLLSTPRGDPAVLRLEPANYAGKAIVLFGSGRTAGTSSIAIRRVVLDGSDAQSRGEDTQQSTLFRATSVRGLELEDVRVQNIAADGLKLAGSARFGPTLRVRLNRVEAEDCGRGALVLQSMVEDVEIRALVTRRQRKGAIDVEASIANAPGPRNVRILGSSLISSPRADGTLPEFGLSLGGEDSDEGAMRDVLVADVEIDAGVWVRNAVGVVFVNVHARSSRYGAIFDERVQLDWYGGSLFGLKGALVSKHHGVVGKVPDGVRFRGVALDSPAGTTTMRCDSCTRHEFDSVTWGASSSVVLSNELAGQAMGGFRFAGGAPASLKVADRDDRPTSPIEAPVVLP